MKKLHLVSGISSRGINRVREHGNLWYEVLDGPSCGSRVYLLESVSTSYRRWMDRDDPDFKVEKSWRVLTIN